MPRLVSHDQITVDGVLYWQDIYDNGAVVKYPVSAPGTTINREISRFAFRQRFTDEEKMTIYVRMDTDEDSTVRAALKIFRDDLMAAETIDLNDPRTIDGLSYLVGIGVLTEDRKTAILT